MKHILFIILISIATSISADVVIEKQLATEALWAHVPSSLKQSIQSVDAATADEDGKITVSDETFSRIKLGGRQLNQTKQEKISASEKSADSEKVTLDVFTAIATGEIQTLPKELRTMYRNMTPEEKGTLRKFAKALAKDAVEATE